MNQQVKSLHAAQTEPSHPRTLDDEDHMPGTLPHGQSRAEFMNKEGSVLFNHLTRAVISPLFERVGTNELVHDALSDIHSKPHADPIGLALDIANTQSYLTASLTHYSISKLVMDNCQLKTSEGTMIESQITNFTYVTTLHGVISEAYHTMLFFPVNLLRYADAAAKDRNRPPVVGTFEDIPHIYRSDWFQDACNTAAIPANSLWGGFSAQPCSTVPPALLSPYLMLDFDTNGHGASTFQFSPAAIGGFKEHWRRYNSRSVAARLKLENNSPLKHESFEYGTSAGCPVRHGKPGLDPNNPRELQRLQVIADFTGTTPEALASQQDSGISYALAAMADMFERCIPPINEALENKRRGIW